jgi:hypothetical protein
MLDSVIESLHQYLDEAFSEWGVLPYSNGSKGLMLVVFKGIPRQDVSEILTNFSGAITVAGNRVHTRTLGGTPDLETDEEVRAREAAITIAAKLLCDIGKKYPSFTLGEFRDLCGSGAMERATTIGCSYKQIIDLDYADPRFFDHLDRIIRLMKTDDDLSRFSSRE